VDGRALAEVRRLAARDAELATEAARLRDLGDTAEAIRARAEAIDSFFSAYAAEESRRRSAMAEARTDLDARRAELSRAREELAAARSEDQRVTGEAAVRRATDHVSVAEARVVRSAEEEAELEREAERLPQELGELEKRAAEVAAALPDLPSPEPGALPEWASSVRAHVFVAAGQLDAQRERLIREANELGTMLVGEPLYGATTSQVQARVEAGLD
jgi:chromosome segregation ATPase